MLDHRKIPAERLVALTIERKDKDLELNRKADWVNDKARVNSHTHMKSLHSNDISIGVVTGNELTDKKR
jgi:hypothetical protein